MLVIASIFIIITIMFNPIFIRNDLSLYYTFVGQMPVFCLGIYFADRGNLKINAGLILLSVLVFSFGNINGYIWGFGFIAFMIIFLAVFVSIKPYLKPFKRLNSFVAYTGRVSLSLFAIHGMMRLPFLKLAEKYETPLFTFLISLIFIASAFLMAWFVRVAEDRVQRLISQKQSIKKPYEKKST